MLVNDTFTTLHIDILVEPLDGAHGGLDVETLHVLPVLLQQRHEEVHGEVDVLDELLLGHLHVPDGDAKAQHLLHLELDGGLEVQHLLGQVVAVSHQSGELTSLEKGDIKRKSCLSIAWSPYLVKTRAQQPGNLFDQSVRGQEGVIGLGQLLDLLLVLVQLLEVVG